MRAAKFSAIICVALVPLFSAAPSFAQVSTFEAAGGQLNSLPPSLRAAVLSGDAGQISQTIGILSGGNAQQRASLANAVIQAAESLVASNPQSAVQAASAAVQTMSDTAVQQASPQQTESVLTTAARIFVSPQVDSTGAASLASATLNVAASVGSGPLTASIASQSMQVAENIVSTDPATAIQMAGAAVQSIQSPTTAQTAPTQVMSVLTSATRILINPAVQQEYPESVVSVSIQISQAVSNPAVYQSSPQGAIQVMAGVYSAVSTTGSASAKQTVTQNLRQASNSQTLNTVNPSNSAQINAILTGPTTTTDTVTTTNNNTTTTNTTDNTLNQVETPTTFTNASPS